MYLKQAKELIRGLLTTDPDTRFTVDDVMVNHWIAVSRIVLHCLLKCSQFCV